MHWLVEFTLSGEDRRLVEDTLSEFGITIEHRDRKAFLSSLEFDAMDLHVLVHALALARINAIKLAVHGHQVAFQIGRLILGLTPDGATIEHRFTTAMAVGGGGATATVDDRSASERAGAETERARQQELEYQWRLKKVSNRVWAALNKPNTATVLRLLGRRKLDTTAMNAIAELISTDGARIWALMNLRAQHSRFAQTIGHQVTFGDEARHAASNRPPYPNPMSREEAQDFIRLAADKWIDLVGSWRGAPPQDLHRK